MRVSVPKPSGPPPPSFAPGPPSSLPPPPSFAPAPPAITREPSVRELTSAPGPKLEDLQSRFYKVNFAYPNEDNDEDTLTLHVGDILIVIETREDGWWRGQRGDAVGLFPVAYCEAVSEDEVKAFIAQNSKKPVAAGAAGAGRAELEREMKELQAEEAALAAQVHKLKDEVASMKEDARKLRKKAREELHEIFDSLPAALYEIPTFLNIQHDLMRCLSLIERSLDSELDHKDLLAPAILECSSFVEEAPKAALAEPKLKAEVDKCVTKVLALQKFLLDEHANINVDLPRKVSTELEVLAAQILAFTKGDLDTSTSSAVASPPLSPSSRSWTKSETPDSISTPKDKKKKKKTEEGNGDSDEKKKEKKKRKDRESMATSPRKESGEAVEDGEDAASPRKEKKAKKEKRSKRATEEGETGEIDE